MTEDPILEHVIVKTSGPLAKVKAVLNKHRTTIFLGTALAASMTLNVLNALKPIHTCAYDLNSADIAYLNRLLDEDQERNPE